MFPLSTHASFTKAFNRFQDRSATVAIVGLGYVGLPLAKAFLNAGFKVLGVDIDPQKIAALHAGKMYIKHLSADVFAHALAEDRFKPTTEFSELAKADSILICAPTPLTSHREPDLSFVEDTVSAITPWLREAHLIVLEFDDLSWNKPRCCQTDLGEIRPKKRQRFFSRLQP